MAPRTIEPDVQEVAPHGSLPSNGRPSAYWKTETAWETSPTSPEKSRKTLLEWGGPVPPAKSRAEAGPFSDLRTADAEK
jgi:hypothetical protein